MSMRITRVRRTRNLVVAALAGSLLAGGAAVAAGEDLFTTAKPVGGGSSDKVALAGQNVDRPRGDGPCTPMDERRYYKVRAGWVSAETLDWENRADAAQKHTFTFTQTAQASGLITGELNLSPAKQKKALKGLGNSLGYELGLEESITKSEAIEYNVPARSRFVAKRGIWQETHAVKRYQRWSNCQERITHLGNITGVRTLYYTSGKKIRFPKHAAPTSPSGASRPSSQAPSSVNVTGPVAIAGDQR